MHRRELRKQLTPQRSYTSSELKLKQDEYIEGLKTIPEFIDNGKYIFESNGPIRTEKYVCVVVYRNQEHRIQRCLESILKAGRDDVGILVVDDNSTDASWDIVTTLTENNSNVTIMRTNERYGRTCNLYMAHHKFVSDDSIVVIVDGDDYLLTETKDVFGIFDKYYDIGKMVTCGNYFCTTPIPQLDTDSVHLVDFNRPWNAAACASWLAPRTYVNKLFKQIPKTVFKEKYDESKWISFAEDIATMPYIIDNCNRVGAFIPEVTYAYDTEHESEHWFHNRQNVQVYIRNFIKKLPDHIGLDDFRILKDLSKKDA